MSRMTQARVTDEQYDWLVERAADEQGDMSRAIRDSIDLARMFSGVLNTRDPEQAFRALLEQSEQERAREEAELAD
jgi:hypothetical protein